jgi:hypothetical protein
LWRASDSYWVYTLFEMPLSRARGAKLGEVAMDTIITLQELRFGSTGCFSHGADVGLHYYLFRILSELADVYIRSCTRVALIH